MRSFVIGATGIVGGYIVEHLVRSGETPLALSRAQHRSSGVVWLQGDLATPETLKLLAAWFPEMDLEPYHCAVGSLASV